GTYSMVRHHALMLVAATVWLGPDSTRRWQIAHTAAAQSFLNSNARSLWPAIEAAEGGLAELLRDSRSRQPAPDALAWLDVDAEARNTYLSYLAAASLGVAALLDSASVWTPDLLTQLIFDRHPDPDFNREEIDRFALAVR